MALNYSIYINKLIKAKLLKPADIARLCGYKDYTKFHRKFKSSDITQERFPNLWAEIQPDDKLALYYRKRDELENYVEWLKTELRVCEKSLTQFMPTVRVKRTREDDDIIRRWEDERSFRGACTAMAYSAALYERITLPDDIASDELNTIEFCSNLARKRNRYVILDYQNRRSFSFDDKGKLYNVTFFKTDSGSAPGFTAFFSLK